MASKGYHDTMRQLLLELWSKGEEARINENLASICRELDRLMPTIKANVEHGAALTDAETERTAELLLELEGRHSILVVEHDMVFVRAIARKVTVLHEGSVLAEGTLNQVQTDERVIDVYLGR